MHHIATLPYINDDGERMPEDLDLNECDICGAAVSDPDLHMDWHASRISSESGQA